VAVDALPEVCQLPASAPRGRDDTEAGRRRDVATDTLSGVRQRHAMQIEAFVARFEVDQRDPAKRVGATRTIIRFLQPLKSCWSWAVARDDILVERNPFGAIKPRRKVKGKTSALTGRGALAVDADLVLNVPQAMTLADACVKRGRGVVWSRCFVLVMALCGLRPGEEVGLPGMTSTSLARRGRAG
jgi:integrase